MTRCFAFLALAGALLALILSTPIDTRANTSFAWHMAQHLVLIFIVPLAALLSAPLRVVSRITSKQILTRAIVVSRALHRIAHPATALALFVAVLWGTHFSGLFDYALGHEWAHVCEHALYLTSGLIFWIPVVAPAPLPALPFPTRILYLIVALPQGALLSFALTSTHHVLYAHYAAQPNALADQNAAAALMWIGGGLVLFIALLVTVGLWAHRETRGSPLPKGYA